MGGLRIGAGIGIGGASRWPYTMRVDALLQRYEVKMGQRQENLSFDQLISFTRTSAATYVNSAGNVVSASANVARFDYDPATLALKGLLIESQQTNLLLRSEEFDNASWGKAGATVTANATVSPDGTADADKEVETSSAATTYSVFQFGSFVSGMSYTFTVYAKAAERAWIALQIGAAATGGGAAPTRYFNLSSGSLGAVFGPVAASNISYAGNGWWRCSMTIAATATAETNALIYLASADNAAVYAGDGTSGLFIWGAQLEAGSYATSYIPTAGSQVTRTADVASIVAPNFASWYNQSEGTFVVEFDYAAGSSADSPNARVVISANSNSSERHMIYNRAGTAQSGLTTTGGSTQAAPGSGSLLNSGVVAKAAYAYKVNDFAFSLDGGSAVSDTSGALPTASQLEIGMISTTAHLDGHVRSIHYFPSRLSDAQLEALSA